MYDQSEQSLSMSRKLQDTSLQRNFLGWQDQLEIWSVNPWRRYSLLLIILLSFFFLGTSVGTINGVLALMDPVGAFLAVVILELMVRVRRNWPLENRKSILLSILDVARIGFLYGLLMEGFKLL